MSQRQNPRHLLPPARLSASSHLVPVHIPAAVLARHPADPVQVLVQEGLDPLAEGGAAVAEGSGHVVDVHVQDAGTEVALQHTRRPRLHGVLHRSVRLQLQERPSGATKFFK